MATVKNFEDLTIWKESKFFIKDVYSLFSTINDYGFKDQITRAAVSVMNNIAEGFERESDKEFARFLYISKASCGEVRSMVHLAIELNYISKENAIILIETATKISVGIHKLIKYLQK